MNQQTWCCILLRHTLEPSRTIRIGAIPAFGISMLLYYEMHAEDQYQNTFLRVGVAVGLAFSLVQMSSFQTELLRSLPPVILISLILSSLAHGTMLRTQKGQTKEKESHFPSIKDGKMMAETSTHGSPEIGCFRETVS